VLWRGFGKERSARDRGSAQRKDKWPGYALGGKNRCLSREFRGGRQES